MRFSTFGVHGEITTMPGCSQVAISHAVFSRERGVGNGTKANDARTAYMKEIGYDYALCTVSSENEHQIAIMRKNGWRLLDTFTSSKTGHVVGLYGKELK